MADIDDQQLDNTTPEPEVIEATTINGVRRSNITEVMESNFLRYSMSVIIARALPDVRDGLKPVHRRILFSMNQNGIRSNGKTMKSARIVGDVMGKYHPHGNMAIYDAMARLAVDWSTRYLLITGQGNFGTMDGDPPAADRYTEAKLNRHAEELLADLDKETVPFRANYDGTEQEPEVLPARLPNLLLNGQTGIAVGMATSIPPHHLGEVVDAVVEMIDNPDYELSDLLKHIKGPDFPTGGIVYGGSSMQEAYASGKGSVTIRGRAVIEERNKQGAHRIVITEIPYMLNMSALVEKMAELVNDKKINGVSDIRDESSRGAVRIVVDLKKDAYPKKILNQLYKLTPLQSAFHYNMLALVDGIQPRVLGLTDILHEYLKHRQAVVRRRTEFELKKAKAREHILEGLKIALDNIDEVVRIIRASATTDEARDSLIKKFKLSEIQANSILAMPLRSLVGLERQKIEDELAQLKKLIADLEALLADEKKITQVVRKELIELKDKYNDERRSEIINQELGKFSDEELIPNEQVVVTLTTSNYIKRSPVSDYKRQGRGGKGRRGIATREEDYVDQMLFVSTHDYILFFTNRGRVFRIKAYEIPNASLNAKGVAIVNLLQLQPEETISSMFKIEAGGKPEGHLFMCTKNGVVKKTAYDKFENVRTSGLIAITLDDGDELKWIRLSSGDEEVVISTAMGQAMRFHESHVRSMGRSARGVRGMRLRKDDYVIGMDIVHEDASIFVISRNGYGKRTKISQFTPHARGGVGIRSAVVNSKTGELVAVRSLRPDANELIVISESGQTIRLGLKDIPELSRATQGVRIMRLNDGDYVASVVTVMEPQEGDIDDSDSGEANAS
ncbi:DNA gyrase subunit A [Candidatus Saccharibacteria bacterium]|nr:DNA gyrase subunit A [Candidatus Saccharibacteria bacterium]MCB9821273.1 DNA gyrase subunit A [Candidatus Nomurabacteria bacterium]